jgi:energy-converting hydrogenase A subunit M
MDNEKVIEILKDYKNKSNNDLIQVLSFLNEDFENTKDLLIKLSKHLDSTEDSYNKILDELSKRKTL